MPVILCSDTICSEWCFSAYCHELDAFFKIYQSCNFTFLFCFLSSFKLGKYTCLFCNAMSTEIFQYVFFLSQLVKNSCCLDSICFINVFVLLRIQKFKNTPPNKTNCIRLLIYIACVTGSWLDNKSMWQRKSESQVINDNF